MSIQELLEMYAILIAGPDTFLACGSGPKSNVLNGHTACEALDYYAGVLLG